MEQLVDKDLTEAFPDLTKTMIADVLRMPNVKGDKQKALDLAQQMKQDHSSQVEKVRKRKVSELRANFDALEEQVIVKVLEENDWIVDNCINPLFAIHAEQQKEKRQMEEKKLAELRRIEMEKKKEQAKLTLRVMFEKVDEDTIAAIIEKNNGELNNAISDILDLVKQKEQEEQTALALEKKQEEEEAERKRQIEFKHNLLIQQLTIQFAENVTEAETRQCLVDNNWDSAKATTALIKISDARKIESLAILVGETMNTQDISEALRRNNSNMQDTLTELMQIKQQRIEQKRKEEEAQKALEELRRKEEEAKRALEEQKRKEQEAEHALAELKKKEEEARKELEEQVRKEEEAKARQLELQAKKAEQAAVQKALEAQKALDEARIAEEKSRQEMEKQAQLQAAYEEKEQVSEDEYLLQRSVYIAKQLQEDTEQFERDLDAIGDEKQAMEDIIRDNPLPPGFNPTQAQESPAGPVNNDELDEDEEAEEAIEESDQVSDVTFTLSKENCAPGETIDVSWENAASYSSSDWIAVYRAKVNRAISKYISYQYVPRQQGTMAFKMPLKYGFFEFRYLDGKKNVIGSSPVITQGPMVTLTAAETEPLTIQVSVKYSSSNKAFEGIGWIGLFEKGKGNKEYISYQKLASVENNSLEFKAPRTGDYTVRYFHEQYYEGASCEITITHNDTLNLTTKDSTVFVEYEINSKDPESDCTWIGLYKTEETEGRNWRRSKWVSQRSGTLEFSIPSHAGKYEARLLANKTYETVTTSNTVDIQPKEPSQES